MIKQIFRLLYGDFTRFLYNKCFTILYLFKGCIVRKPLHIRKMKYIHLGKNVRIDSGVRLECYNTKNKVPNLTMGEGTSVEFNCTFLCTSNLVIGKNCMFASSILVTTENHCTNPIEGYRRGELMSRDVYIGDECWIGEGVLILPGVNIGEKCIIGAGSVVTNSIPAFSIAVGNPARVIKKYNFIQNKWQKIEMGNEYEK